MTSKPLPRHQTKVLLETFKRHSVDLSIYEIKTLTDQQRKELLTSPNSWIVVGKSKWT